MFTFTHRPQVMVAAGGALPSLATTTFAQDAALVIADEQYKDNRWAGELWAVELGMVAKALDGRSSSCMGYSGHVGYMGRMGYPSAAITDHGSTMGQHVGAARRMHACRPQPTTPSAMWMY